MWFVRPVTVVRDEPGLVALYVAPGTICKWPYTMQGQKLRLPQDRWIIRDEPWFGRMLRLTEPGASHSVLLFWNEADQFVFLVHRPGDANVANAYGL